MCRVAQRRQPRGAHLAVGSLTSLADWRTACVGNYQTGRSTRAYHDGEGHTTMAQVVLGIGHSHTPQISVDPEEWPNLGRTEQVSPHVPQNLDALLQVDLFREKHARV